MKQQGKFLDRIMLGADLPGEKTSGVPLVELIGDGRVLIENHQGVTAYGCSEICVKVRYGFLGIAGTGLKLACMSDQQLVITGKIAGITIHAGRK